MPRIDYFALKPDFITQLRAITKQQESFGLDAKLRALVETRVSQINGCVYCTDLHSREARERGEQQQRLDSLPVWRESPFFTEREKAALAWAESMTCIATTHAGDSEYEALRLHFSETEIVELSLSISLTNFWNRMAGGFRKMPPALPAAVSS
jgi:AhpD family alkylhydroperoxidase